MFVNGYEEGLHAGRAAAPDWRPNPWTRADQWQQALREAPNAHSGRRGTDYMRAELARLTQEDLLACAADLHRRKIAALPDLGQFPELAGADQYLDDKARGFAAGAGIDVREVHLESYWLEIFFRIADGSQLFAPTCSEFWFPDTPDGPLIGKGWDDIMHWYRDNPFPLPPEQATEPAVEPVPPQDPTLGYPTYGSCNGRGLCINHGGGATYEYEEISDEVLFPAPVFELVLRRCATAQEAVDMLERYNLYWGPCNLLVGDAGGQGAVFEKSRRNYAFRMGDGQPLITTYGGCDDAAMRRLCDTGTPLFAYYERRLQVMREIVAAAEHNLDLETFWRAILHHDDAAPGCTHRETRPPGVELFTFGAYAQLPRAGRIFSRSIARADGGLRYACQNPPTERRYRFALE